MKGMKGLKPNKPPWPFGTGTADVKFEMPGMEGPSPNPLGFQPNYEKETNVTL